MDQNFHFYNATNILPVAFPIIAGSAFTQFDYHFEEIRGGVEPWLMACWKGCVDFLLSVIELLFRSLTAEALQGKTCQNPLFSGGGGSVWANISGRRGRPREYFLVSKKL